MAPGSRITGFSASGSGLALLLYRLETPNLQRAPTWDIHVQTFYVLLFFVRALGESFRLSLEARTGATYPSPTSHRAPWDGACRRFWGIGFRV